MGLVYGGLAQVMVGIMEYRKGNTFGMVAFTSYGLFWWSLVILLLLPKMSSIGIAAPEKEAMAAYFFMWGLFTLVMFFGTLRKNRVLQFVFLSLAILFFLLTVRDLTGNIYISTLTGYEGIICGLSAVYLALAEVLNEVYEKPVLPLFPINKNSNNAW
jgi:succinate-acetate transporter protein